MTIEIKVPERYFEIVAEILHSDRSYFKTFFHEMRYSFVP